MRRILIVIMVVATAFGISCKKKDSQTPSGTVYKGIVLHSICCDVVIRTVGAEKLGQTGWIDSNYSSGYPVYDGVFTLDNPCQFNAPKDTFSFVVVPAEVQNCVCCMAAIGWKPATRYAIKVVNQ
jgi:hypothetical protein